MAAPEPEEMRAHFEARHERPEWLRKVWDEIPHDALTEWHAVDHVFHRAHEHQWETRPNQVGVGR